MPLLSPLCLVLLIILTIVLYMFIILIIVYCYYLLYHHIETPHIVIVSRCVYPANMSNIPHCEVFGRYFSQENSQLVILRNLV